VSLIADWIILFFVIDKLLSHDFCILNQGIILFSAGMFAGFNINIAHELSHKIFDIFDSALCLLTMSKNLYSHWV
jgi:hypothetical protein